MEIFTSIETMVREGTPGRHEPLPGRHEPPTPKERMLYFVS